jgi:hypothetical protein
MHAKTGDHIVIETSKRDTRRRHGDVLEVLGDQDSQHYRVRWDDGHESIYFPGPDAQLRPADWRPGPERVACPAIGLP